MSPPCLLVPARQGRLYAAFTSGIFIIKVHLWIIWGKRQTHHMLTDRDTRCSSLWEQVSAPPCVETRRRPWAGVRVSGRSSSNRSQQNKDMIRWRTLEMIWGKWGEKLSRWVSDLSLPSSGQCKFVRFFYYFFCHCSLSLLSTSSVSNSLLSCSTSGPTNNNRIIMN